MPYGTVIYVTLSRGLASFKSTGICVRPDLRKSYKKNILKFISWKDKIVKLLS
jgi:hypothetical protein